MSQPEWPTRDLVTHRVRVTPRATATIRAEDGETLTYAALDETVNGVAGHLVTASSEDGRVGLLAPTGLAAIAAVHAAHRLGRSVVLLDPDAPVDRLVERVELTAPALLAAPPETLARARSVADRTDVDGVVSLATDVGPEWDESPAVLTRDDEALVAFTSGTTGDPSAVRLTVGNLVASAVGSAVRLGVSPGDRWLCCLPIHHLGGVSIPFRTAFYGATTVVQRGFDAAETAALIDAHDVTGVSLVPTQLHRLLAADWTPPAALRFVLLGGAPASPDLLQRALAADVPVCPTYGTTETASQIATARPETVASDPETVGSPLLFTDVTIVDDAGAPVPTGETGEIVVSGPTVTPGYVGETAAADRGPHGLHTGDLGVRDEAGRLRVLGRLDDRIVTGGETVQPATVARVLRDHPGVADAAVVGLPDEEWGEVLAGLVAAEGVSGDALRAFCRERLAPHEVPKLIAVTETLPRTASGTVDRRAVRQRLQSLR